MGMMLAVIAACCLTPGSYAHFGTVCTSYCWINSASHGRRLSNPYGNEREHVRLGTRFAARTAPWLSYPSCWPIFVLQCWREVILALIAWARGAVISIEQPVNSLLVHSPSFQLLLQFFADASHVAGWACKGVQCATVALGHFGAESMKPIWVYTTEPSLADYLMRVDAKSTLSPSGESDNGPVAYQCLGL